jgi:hypothetical protein
MKTVTRVLVVIGLIVVVMLGVWIIGQLRMINLPAGGNPLPLLPQPTPTIYASATTVIERVQALSRLETAAYHVEKVITAESGQGTMDFLFGDRLLLVAYGQVIAGVDLGAIGPDDVMTDHDQGVVFLRLPASEVFVATLDNSRTYVYDRSTGMMGMNEQLETAARQEAERMIMQAALEDGLLETAETNAKEFMRTLLLGMGFKQVLFVDVLPTPTPSPVPAAPMVTITALP